MYLCLEEAAMLNVPAEKPVDNDCRYHTLPDVIIFGAKKCGTSTLQEFLPSKKFLARS